MTTAVTLLYDDEAMAAVMKPAGVAIVPAPRVPPSACLRNRVASQLGTRAWVVHRLDRGPSGARRVGVEALLPDDLRALHAWLDTHWTAEPPG